MADIISELENKLAELEKICEDLNTIHKKGVVKLTGQIKICDKLIDALKQRIEHLKKETK